VHGGQDRHAHQPPPLCILALKAANNSVHCRAAAAPANCRRQVLQYSSLLVLERTRVLLRTSSANEVPALVQCHAPCLGAVLHTSVRHSQPNHMYTAACPEGLNTTSITVRCLHDCRCSSCYAATPNRVSSVQHDVSRRAAGTIMAGSRCSCYEQ
jgi:hypothetical protein